MAIMKKTYRYIVLLALIMGQYAHAQERVSEEGDIPSIVPIPNRFTGCFVDESSESSCWQQMLSESNPAVRYDFGAHYANGDGVKQDFPKGRYWIHQAALKGYPLAQYNLGVMFFDGIGGTQSKECAVHWLNKAASADDETREMAQQALAALSELTAAAGMPKVYRVLTVKECEQLPEVVFPGWEIESIQVDAMPDDQHDTEEMEPSLDVPMTFSLGLDVLSENLLAAPNQDVQPLLIEPEPEPEPEVEVETNSPVSTFFREKMGQYFIGLGHQLLGQELKTEQKMAHHDSKDNTQLNTPVPAVHADESTVIESVNVTPEPMTAEATISTSISEGEPPEEPLFVARILDHPVGTVYDQLDVMAISPNAVDTKTPTETPEVEVAAPILKPSDAEPSDVPLASPADEPEKLAPPEKEETLLPAETNVVETEPKSAETVPMNTSAQVSEPAEVVAHEAPKVTPRAVEKAAPRPLNLGGGIRSASKGHYTLQLSSASQAEPLQALAKRHKLTNYLVYETQRHGRRWYVLVYGEYTGMTQAKQALQQLPGALKKDTPWIRSLAHVQTEL